jgi:hypothetical protein
MSAPTDMSVAQPYTGPVLHTDPTTIRRVLATITRPATIRRILGHLGARAEPLARTPARDPTGSSSTSARPWAA